MNRAQRLINLVENKVDWQHRIEVNEITYSSSSETLHAAVEVQIPKNICEAPDGEDSTLILDYDDAEDLGAFEVASAASAITGKVYKPTKEQIVQAMKYLPADHEYNAQLAKVVDVALKKYYREN